MTDHRATAAPRRRRPSDEPVDLEQIDRLRTLMDSGALQAPVDEIDGRHYSSMARVRQNSRQVDPLIFTRQDAQQQQEVAASLLAVIRSRRSCRSFDPRPVDPQDVELILEAGRWAPSAGNAQPWEFLVVQAQESKEKIASMLAGAVAAMRSADPTFPGFANPRYIASTPLLILVYGDVRTMAAYPYPMPRENRRALFEQSIAMCIENMWLMATRLGMAATNYTMGHPAADAAVRDAFGVPENFVMPTMLLVGYPRHVPMPRPRRRLAEIVHRERFDTSRVRSDEELVDFFYRNGVRGRGFR